MNKTKMTRASAASVALVLLGLLAGWGPSQGEHLPAGGAGSGDLAQASGPGDDGAGGRGPGEGAPHQGVHATPASPQRVEGSYFVSVRADLDPSVVADEIARDHGGVAEHVYEHALHGFNYRGSDEGAAGLREDPRVDGVGPDYEVYIADTITKDVKRIRASHTNGAIQTAYGAGYRGSGVYVGILDTGIDRSHPDLADNIAPSSMWKNCTGSGDPADGHGHGTVVSGNASARDNTVGVRGAAPRATLIPVKVLGDNGSGTFSQVACGVDHLTALANANPTKRFVGNMSLSGGGGSSHCSDGSIRQAICQSVAAGVVYAVAAGNDNGDNAAKYWPAAFPEVITVSALDDADGEPGSDKLASFSNTGAAVDLIAPGVSVLSPYPGNKYVYSSGTSNAAPFVSGVAALVLALDPGLSPNDVKSLLKATGECPNGSMNVVAGPCPSGQWSGDNDGIPEPLVRAFEAADAAVPVQVNGPSVTWLAPSSGQVLVGNGAAVEFTVTDDDDEGVPESTVASVQLRVGATTVKSWTSSPSTGGFTHSLDTSAFPDGSKTLSVHVVDNDTNAETASRTVTFSNASGFTESFDGSGWNFTGLWHVVDGASGFNCASPPYTSPTRSLYYGRDNTCTYNTGGSNSGMATSPVIDVHGSSVPVSFSSLRVIEQYRRVRDQTYVQVSYNGGSWQTVWSRTSRDANNSSWKKESFTLSPQGTSMRLRFVFQADSRRNDFLGWLVDDVAVGGGANAAPVIGWSSPANGATLLGENGGVTVAFTGSDEDLAGTLDAEWFVDGVSKGSASYNGSSGRYEAQWNTSGLSDGPHTLEAQLTDSGGATSKSAITVHYDAANDPPGVSWSNPTNGGVVTMGAVPLRIAAIDDRDAPADLDVQWRVKSGPPGASSFAPASFDAAKGEHQAVWDTSGGPEGSYTLEARATDGDSLVSIAEITVEVVSTVLFQDFEQSTSGWTTSGLWGIRQNLACPGATYASPSTAAYYGNPSTCTYDTGRSSNSGTLTSPNVPIGGPATLTFASRRQVESSSRTRDITSVDVSYNNGGSWQRVWQRSSRDPSSSAWTTETVALSPTGSTVRVRFGFDTTNRYYNNYLGWLVDDIKIVPN